MKRIILASTSPRRKELLESIGVKFEVIPSEYEEIIDPHADPEQLVQTFSAAKARSLQSKAPDTLIIGADTIVYINNTILGKPDSREQASEMLHLLQGTTHTVYTGYTVLESSTGKEVTKVIQTKITLKNLTDEEIDHYIDRANSMDKAGAYAIQGIGLLLTSRIEGDYSAVIGLPLRSLADTLQEFGVKLL